MPNPVRGSSPVDDDQGSYRMYSGAGNRSMKATTSDTKPQRSFWSVLANKAKSSLLDENMSPSDLEPTEDSNSEGQPQFKQGKPCDDSKQGRTDIQKRLEALTSSLSNFSGSLGNALEEGLNMVETKASDILSSSKRTSSYPKSTSRQDSIINMLRNDSLKKSSPQQRLGSSALPQRYDPLIKPSSNRQDSVFNNLQQRPSISKPLQEQDFLSDSLQLQRNLLLKTSQKGDPNLKPTLEPHLGIQDYTSLSDKDTQLKASRDVAMAMAARAKLLSRELKEAKSDLAMAKERCARLEEENRIIRESLSDGSKPDEEDLVRIQLETLLAEKARLAQENAYYARENQFLREMLEYHRLTLQHGGALSEECHPEAAECHSEEAEDLPPETIISTVSS